MRACADVLDIRIVRVALEGDAPREHVVNGRVEKAAVSDRVLLAVGSLRSPLLLCGIRLTGDDVDHTAGRIAAVKAALGPLQNLNTFDVGELIEHLPEDSGHVIDEQSDTRIGP